VVRIPWWLTRPSGSVQQERIREGLCPRCGSARTVPVIYGLIRDLGSIRAKYPDGFLLGGDLVRSFDDPGPDRACERCGKRFYAFKPTLTP
jgi:hypothetical protein